jgi:hypothetical protein
VDAGGVGLLPEEGVPKGLITKAKMTQRRGLGFLIWVIVHTYDPRYSAESLGSKAGTTRNLGLHLCRLSFAPGNAILKDSFMEIVPAGEVIADLEKQASDYEAETERKSGTEAARLREKAKLCYEWIAALKSGKWKS